MSWKRFDYELRRGLKRLLPPPIVRAVQRWELTGLVRTYQRLSSEQERFDRVYRKRIWRSPLHEGSLSGTGSEGEWLERSVEYVLGQRLLDGKSVLDVGCGDFSFGSRVCASASLYTAVDVSRVAVELAVRNARDRANVRVRCMDATEALLPASDVVLIRQVLQHLPNALIARMLSAALGTGAKDILVFEEVPSGEFTANIDLPVSGQLTRLIFGSGVDLRVAPFGGAWEVAAKWEGGGDAAAGPTALVCYRSRI